MDKDTKVIATTVIGIIALLGVFVVLFGGGDGKVRLGGAGELEADTASSTTYTLVAETAIVIHGTTTTACIARTIGVVGSDINIIFTDDEGVTPTRVVGLLQLASTTAVYENTIYPCGQITIFPFSIGTLDIIETK